jgi:hypothetical protein
MRISCWVLHLFNYLKLSSCCKHQALEVFSLSGAFRYHHALVCNNIMISLYLGPQCFCCTILRDVIFVEAWSASVMSTTCILQHAVVCWVTAIDPRSRLPEKQDYWTVGLASYKKSGQEVTIHTPHFFNGHPPLRLDSITTPSQGVRSVSYGVNAEFLYTAFSGTCRSHRVPYMASGPGPLLYDLASFAIFCLTGARVLWTPFPILALSFFLFDLILALSIYSLSFFFVFWFSSTCFF